MSNAAVSISANEAHHPADRKSPKVVHQRINKAAVLGAGTMGARIAAHLANAGLPCYLLDIIPPDASDKSARNKIVAVGLEGAVKSKPAAFFQKGLEKLITIGNFDDDLAKLAECDWIGERSCSQATAKRLVPAMRKS